MEKFTYICNHKPDVSGRHIGESVTLLSSRGNLVHFNLDGDYVATLITCYFHAAVCRMGIYRCGVVVYYVQGFYQSLHGIVSNRLHTFRLLTLPTLIGALWEA